MKQNDLIKKVLLVELYKSAPEEIKQVLRVNEVEIEGRANAEQKEKELGIFSHRDLIEFDYNGIGKYRVFTFPELTDADIANLEQIAAIHSNKELPDIARSTSKTHFWVKFWSIFTIACMAISMIGWFLYFNSL